MESRNRFLRVWIMLAVAFCWLTCASLAISPEGNQEGKQKSDKSAKQNAGQNENASADQMIEGIIKANSWETDAQNINENVTPSIRNDPQRRRRVAAEALERAIEIRARDDPQFRRYVMAVRKYNNEMLDFIKEKSEGKNISNEHKRVP